MKSLKAFFRSFLIPPLLIINTVNYYVTMQVKDEHQAGTLTIGDYVIISFIDGDPEYHVFWAFGIA